MSILTICLLQVYPPEVSFGVLCPNGMYATTVTLKNIGIDSCRFHIKCPRNADGVSVTLHSETNFVSKLLGNDP